MVFMLNKSLNIGAKFCGPLISKLPFVFWEEYVCYVITIANTRGKGQKKKKKKKKKGLANSGS
jgi:hypothetical protein